MTFSIIIPVYNVAQYLRECLDSVSAQTFVGWEAICVDDGATDGSGAILDEYASKDNRFKVVHKVNGGVSSARNTGLEILTGDWVAFLDGDDVWAPWTLEVAAKAIDSHADADLIRFDTADFYENGKYPWLSDDVTDCQVEIEDIRKFISVDSVSCFFGGKIYKRNIVDNIRFDPYTVGEDLLFLTQCMMLANKQVYVKLSCYGYRQRVGSASHSGVNARIQRDELGFVSKILFAYDTTDKVVDKALWRAYSNKITEQFCAGQMLLPKAARDELWLEWRGYLKGVMRLKKLPLFQRIRMVFLLGLPFVGVAYLLCCLPRQLKKLGLHR